MAVRNINLTYYEIKRPRPGYIQLKRAFSAIPPWSENLHVSILNFALFCGLSSIPAQTAQKLNSDPYFKYTFGHLVGNHYRIYQPQNEKELETRDRLIGILLFPRSATDRDISFGLGRYLNNFPIYMPDCGTYNSFKPFIEEPEYGELKRSFNCLETILKNRDIREEAVRMGKNYEHHQQKFFKEYSYEQRLPYYKFCIDLFCELMEVYGFSYNFLKH